MKTFIESYRGWDIYFDTEKERFACGIDNVNWADKQSYSSAKKFIDEYIKSNTEFKPFDVCYLDGYRRGKTETIIGIRKDKRFITREADGKNGQISEYDEKSIYLVNPANDKIQAAIAVYESEIDELKRKIREEEEKFIKVSLASIKANYL